MWDYVVLGAPVGPVTNPVVLRVRAESQHEAREEAFRISPEVRSLVALAASEGKPTPQHYLRTFRDLDHSGRSCDPETPDDPRLCEVCERRTRKVERTYRHLMEKHKDWYPRAERDTDGG